MAKFSERHGYVEVDDAVQIEVVDDYLRTALWNVIHYLSTADSFAIKRAAADVFEWMWMHHFHMLRDSVRSNSKYASLLRDTILSGEWFEVYDAIEVFATRFGREMNQYQPHEYDALFNGILEKHRAGYRLVEGVVVPIADPIELEAISSAIKDSAVPPGARHGLQQALNLFGDRNNPDYPNAVKEAISAAESAARTLAPGTGTLAAAVDKLKRDGVIHGALADGWKKLYGHTSDEAGIRHGNTDAPVVTQDLARYYIVTCAAFIGLLATIQVE